MDPPAMSNFGRCNRFLALGQQPSRHEHRLAVWNTWLSGHSQEVLAGLFAVISLFLMLNGEVELAKRTSELAN